jgi:hypothetical protein
MFNKLSNLDQSRFRDAAPLFNREWVIRGLEFYEGSLADWLRSNIRFEWRCIRIDFDSAR